MSLLIDLLRKFKGGNRKTSVHPLIAKGKGRGRQINKKALFLLLPLVAVSSLLAYFITQLILGSPVPEPTEHRRVKTVSTPVERVAVKQETPVPKTRPVEPIPEEVQERKAKGEEKVKKPRRSNLKSGEVLRKVIKDIKPVNVKKKTVKRSDMNLNTLLYMADRSFREGDLLKSARLYERSLRIKANDSVVNNLLVIYARLGRFEEAEELLRRFPRERFVYTYLVELSRAGHNGKALEVSEKFLHFDREGYIHLARGYLYEKLGDRGKALKEFRKAYRKNPGNALFAYNYARILEALGMYKDAYSVYNSLNSRELEPNLKRIVEQRLRYLKFMGF